MNREIEFRAWLRKHLKVVDVIRIDFEAQEITYLEIDFEYEDIVREKTALFKDVSLLQYTGLKDRNGVKIFEGDIVIYKFQNEEFKTIELTVYFDDEDCSFSLAYKGKPYLSMEKSHIKYYEVIGNIYENPKLLKKV